jgi:putative (di)nucleoside polyphosphate hydrolase
MAAEIYRPNVAALLVNREGRLLIAERIRHRNAWQFPQGGVDRGEDPDEALVRELGEEIGLRPGLIEVVMRKGGYRYRFPKPMRRFGRNIGQEQTYYLCRFLGTDADINLKTSHPEFRSFKWIAPHEFRLEWLPEFKRAVYRQVMQDFFGVSLPGGEESPCPNEPQD